MEIKIPKWLEKDINMLIVQKSKKYMEECICSMVYKEKQKLFDQMRKDYINNKMTGKEFFYLTQKLPSKEMQIKRRENLRYLKESCQERFYLKLLAENGDQFGYVDEYFQEIMQKVEVETS